MASAVNTASGKKRSLGKLCMFAGCSNRDKMPGISFFRIPILKDKTLARRWFDRSKRADLSFDQLTRHYRVCSDHFEEEDMEEFTAKGQIKRRVKCNAIPLAAGKSKITRRVVRRIIPASEQELTERMDTVEPTTDVVEPQGTQTDTLFNSMGSQTDDDSQVSHHPLEDHNYSSTNPSTSTVTVSPGLGLGPKWMVFEESLKELLDDICCKFCKTPTLEKRIFKNYGSAFSFNATCAVCKKLYSWCSQQRIGKKYAGNLLLAAATLLTGQTYGGIKKFLDLLGLQGISAQTYYNYQRDLLVPQISEFYDEERTKVINLINSRGKEVILSGDGRYDSPGHSARYCTYTFVECSTGLVTHSYSVESKACTSSNDAEKQGFILCLKEAKQQILNLKAITTDGHTGVAAYMKNETNLVHNLDIWHWTKNFKKHLRNKCSVNGKELLPWLQQIGNHIWYCSMNCQGSVERLTEMINSMQYHIVNQHTDFPNHTLFTECAHDLSFSQTTSRQEYLTEGSPAHKILVDFLKSNNVKKNLKKLTYGADTGTLESFYSMLLAYAPKRLDFDVDYYRARVCLAILDHNENVGRATKKDENGQDRFELYWNKPCKDFRVKKVYSEKTFKFRTTLLRRFIKAAKLPTIKRPGNRGLNRATKPKPNLQVAIQGHISRFTK